MTRIILATLAILTGFFLGACIDHAVFAQAMITESPTQEWCDAAFVRKADFGLHVKSTYTHLEAPYSASRGEFDSHSVRASQDSPQARLTQR